MNYLLMLRFIDESGTAYSIQHALALVHDQTH